MHLKILRYDVQKVGFLMYCVMYCQILEYHQHMKSFEKKLYKSRWAMWPKGHLLSFLTFNCMTHCSCLKFKPLSFALPNSYIFFFKLFKNHSLKSLILLLKTLFFAFVRIKCFYHTKIIYTFNTNNTICRKLLQIQYNKAFLEKKISIILCS